MIRVLLVDDHGVVRRGLRGYLEMLDDIEVVGEADNGLTGVELSASLTPDVILMDLVMPSSTASPPSVESRRPSRGSRSSR